MSDIVKLIIEIPKSALELLNTTGVDWLGAEHILSAVAEGIPLDDIDSDETRAYFDGQAYGWEEGRKALIDDVKAEIRGMDYHMIDCDVLVSQEEVLDIIDKYKEVRE